MDDTYLKKVITAIVVIALVVLSFFLLKPILISIITAFILAFIFTPLYNWVYKIVQSKNLASSLICVVLLLLIVLPIVLLTPIMINQSIELYIASQQMDFVKPFQKIFPSLFTSQEFSIILESVISSSVTKTINSLGNSLTIDNFVNLFLQSLVIFFTFFFVLRDKEHLLLYIKSLLPFSKDVEKKLFESSKGITASVIYGQVVIGIIQGILVGIGFFIFKVPNALVLTLIASLAGIFPVIGTTIIWIPVAIYLLIAGNALPALGVILFGILSSFADNLLKPIIISRRTKMNSALILVGMLGGLFFFGVVGFILGPLILAYLFILLDIYRSKRMPGVFIENSEKTSK